MASTFSTAPEPLGICQSLPAAGRGGRSRTATSNGPSGGLGNGRPLQPGARASGTGPGAPRAQFPNVNDRAARQSSAPPRGCPGLNPRKRAITSPPVQQTKRVVGFADVGRHRMLQSRPPLWRRAAAICTTINRNMRFRLAIARSGVFL